MKTKCPYCGCKEIITKINSFVCAKCRKCWRQNVKDKFDLIKMKLEILRLKADDYNWQCHTPDDVRKELEEILKWIDAELQKEQE